MSDDAKRSEAEEHPDVASETPRDEKETPVEGVKIHMPPPIPELPALPSVRVSLPPRREWISHTVLDVAAIAGVASMHVFGELDPWAALLTILGIAAPWLVGQIRGNKGGMIGPVSLIASVLGVVMESVRKGKGG